jgi:hypothetical protein
MVTPTDAQRRAWMAQWRRAGPALERVRLDELFSAKLSRIADDLEDACVASVRATPPGPVSGLIAQQAALHRPRRV